MQRCWAEKPEARVAMAEAQHELEQLATIFSQSDETATQPAAVCLFLHFMNRCSIVCVHVQGGSELWFCSSVGTDLGFKVGSNEWYIALFSRALLSINWFLMVVWQKRRSTTRLQNAEK